MFDNIGNCNLNHYQCVSYVVDLCGGNYKNNLNTAIVDISIENDHIYSSSIYSNINNGRQNPILQILSTIKNIKTLALALDTLKTIFISY